MNSAPGWYHAQGDPPDTHRWWDGSRWVGQPSPVNAQPMDASVSPHAFPGAPPALGVQDGHAGYAHVAIDRSPIEWMLLPLKRYAEFDGRSCRAEYWWFQLMYFVIVLTTVLPGVILSESSSALGYVLLGIGVLAMFALLIPGIAVSIRRLHDTDRPGTWILIGIIPIISYIGGFVLLYFYVCEGDRGPNKFGPPHQ